MEQIMYYVNNANDMTADIEIELFYGKFQSKYFTLVIRKGNSVKRVAIDETTALHIIDTFLLQIKTEGEESELKEALYK